MAYKPAASLPAAIGDPDATIPQVMAFRHESARTVQRKIASGAYQSYKSGENRLILARVERRQCRRFPDRRGTSRRVGLPHRRDLGGLIVGERDRRIASAA